MSCPGSFKAEQAAGPRTTSIYAEEGTTAHGVFAAALLRDTSPYQLTDNSYMAKPLHECWLAAKQLIAGRRFLVEQRLKPMPVLLDLWGTADVVVFDQHGHVVMLIDLKFGAGVVIEPTTIQLAIYALLAAQQFGGSPAGITAVILQPRALHEAGPVRQHHHTIAELKRTLQVVLDCADEALLPDAPRISGPWCKFCAAKNTCTERHRAFPPGKSGSSFFHQGSPHA